MFGARIREVEINLKKLEERQKRIESSGDYRFQKLLQYLDAHPELDCIGDYTIVKNKRCPKCNHTIK